ncbi:hypothetical protein [Leptonema illini]|uniref:Uncharacterized protein n=1 Tax=Leptonema illini DSM 21528 TaxID=929563 RepID=H2CHU5_9LEPT|nr:hypothetical protein [Leptonema illini]EHQ06967.1 hypothetical protein Lepil_2291 [Leptonema illini DSM 21528]
MRRILLVFVILSSCTFGVDGDETVSTGEALQELKLAALSNVLRCHPEAVEAETYALQQSLCLDAENKSILLRRSDVEGCVERIRFFPCQDSYSMTIFFTRVFAMNCPMETVPFAFNSVSHPFQGNIMTGFDGRPGFWYSCL